MEEKDLCLRLLHADTEYEVIDLLMNEGYWEDTTKWRLYGDIENNYSSAGNQVDEADAAIVEKLTNSRDAVLMNECLENGINPEGPEAPKSVQEAMAKFFERNSKTEFAGQLRYMDASQRREIATRMDVYLTGHRPGNGYPCVNIADTGEGQTPMKIPTTILSLGKSIKMRIPFVHGKFNMGGTAVLSYCGQNNLQLVISKRNPKLLDSSNDVVDTHWGFTIVRREDPEGNRESSVFKFLAPIKNKSDDLGEILHFESDSFPLFAEYNEPYKVEKEWGTLFKLYECKASRQDVRGTGGILRPLDLLAPDLGFPYRLHECRYEVKGKTTPGSFVHQVNGLRVRLYDRRKELLFFDPHSVPFEVDKQRFIATIYAFKEPAKLYRDSDKGILFTLNGQSQGWLPDNFFTRSKVGLSFLKNRLLVVVDCNNLTHRAQEDFFMPSRDRLRKGPFRNSIEEKIEQILRNHQGLEDLQEELQRKLSEEKMDDSKPLENILSDLFKHSSSLSRIFLKGQKLSSAFKSSEVQKAEKDFEGKEYPEFFKFKKVDYGKTLRKSAHLDSSCRVLFETDAENDFFGRKHNCGSYQLFLRSDSGLNVDHNFDNYLNLFNGVGTLNIDLKDKSLVVGQKLLFTLKVTHPLRIVDDPFSNTFELTLQPPMKKKGGGNSDRVKPPNPDKKGKDREQISGIAFPQIQKVYTKHWKELEMDERSALVASKKKSDGQGTDFVFYINMENTYLQYEKKGNPKMSTVYDAYFEFGLAIASIGIIYDEQEHSGNKSLEAVEDKIRDTTRSLAPFIIPMIEELGKLDPKTDLLKELSS